MHEKHLYEYAVIRVVPRVEREEFINIGVVLLCKKHRFLQTLYTINAPRLNAFSEKLDIEDITCYLQGFEKISNGDKDGGPIARLDMPSRFRWLTANRSTVLQTSKVHPGLCDDPKKKLEELYRDLVL